MSVPRSTTMPFPRLPANPLATVPLPISIRVPSSYRRIRRPSLSVSIPFPGYSESLAFRGTPRRSTFPSTETTRATGETSRLLTKKTPTPISTRAAAAIRYQDFRRGAPTFPLRKTSPRSRSSSAASKSSSTRAGSASISARSLATSSSPASPETYFETSAIPHRCELARHAVLERAAEPAEQHIHRADLHAGRAGDVLRGVPLAVLQAQDVA